MSMHDIPITPTEEGAILARARIRFSHLYFLKNNPRTPKSTAKRLRRPNPEIARSSSTASTEPDPPIDALVVRSTDSGWSLLVDDLGTPAWTVSTKKKAVAAAIDAARELETRLVIETRAGTVQRTHDYTAEA